MRIAVYSLFVLAFLFCMSSDVLAQNERVELRWRLPDGEALYYDHFQITTLDSQLINPVGMIAITPVDILKEGESVSFPIWSVSAIPLSILGELPKKPVKPGDKWTSRISSTVCYQAGARKFTQEDFQLEIKCRYTTAHQSDGNTIAELQFEGSVKSPSPKLESTNIHCTGTILYDVSARRMREFRAITTSDKKLKKGGVKETIAGVALKYKRSLALEGDELSAMIDEAVRDCVDALVKHQSADGFIGDELLKEKYPMGSCSLSLLALLRAGVAKEAPVVEKALAYLRTLDLKKTYGVGLLCMVIEAWYTPLEELKNTEGVYEENALDREPFSLSKDDLVWMRKAANWLVETQTFPGAWHYTSEKVYEGGKKNNTGKKFDHSNSQYGALGLFSAARCGVFSSAKVWIDILHHWMETQDIKGERVHRVPPPSEKSSSSVAIPARGWRYSKDGPTTFTMTAGGIGTVALAHACLRQVHRGKANSLAKTADYSVKCGSAWLEKNSSMMSVVFSGKNYYYYMYGFERAMVITGQHYIGGRNWYREGAALLCQTERPAKAGRAWITRWGGAKDTAFVLLFLKRASSPVGAISEE